MKENYSASYTRLTEVPTYLPKWLFLEHTNNKLLLVPLDMLDVLAAFLRNCLTPFAFLI